MVYAGDNISVTLQVKGQPQYAQSLDHLAINTQSPGSAPRDC